MEKINVSLMRLLLWVSSYLNLLAFVLFGGYVYLKSGREDLRRECRRVTGVIVIFAAAGALLSLLGYLNGLFGYSADMQNVLNFLGNLLSVVRIVTYAVFAIFAVAAPAHFAENPTDDSTEPPQGA